MKIKEKYKNCETNCETEKEKTLTILDNEGL